MPSSETAGSEFRQPPDVGLLPFSSYNFPVAYFLGIDGGATKTHIVLSNGTGRPVVEGQSGPSNYHIVGVEQAAANLSAAISQAFADSAVVPDAVKAACAGMAGFDGASDRKNVQKILTSALEASGMHCSWRSLNDSVVAWAGAFHGDPGALIASGSGAVAFAVGENGRSARADGLGHWLGDAGSGYDIGRRGLRAALAALDGRGPTTRLTEQFRAVAGNSQQEWTGWLAELDSSISHAHEQLRSFAPSVAEAAAGGDAVAHTIMHEAGTALASTAAAVLRKVGLLTDAKVATAGSVLEQPSCLYQAFRAALNAHLPGCQIVPARAGPARGAALLARNPGIVPRDALQAHG
ncbi:MAG: hypothetical protein F4Y84_14940 [Caldilineaceae bacterium SB0665_bin_25]|nr:hypothetical protein [Caldilineaceae bacterium SB0665_bin_25]